jgi:hypothetical protein
MGRDGPMDGPTNRWTKSILEVLARTKKFQGKHPLFMKNKLILKAIFKVILQKKSNIKGYL